METHHPDACDFNLRAVFTTAKRRRLDQRAQKALLAASEDLTLCILASLGRLRDSSRGLGRLLAELRHKQVLLSEAQERARILAVRLGKLEARHRPHYTPELRFSILAHMRRYMLTVEETARRFLITPQTIYNWLRELERSPDAQTVGSLLKPVPPLRRYADVVRQLARDMKAHGFGGKKKIAEILARISWKVSARSVGRFLKEKPLPTPRPPSAPAQPTTVRGRYPNHLWLADITLVPLIVPFVRLHLAVILDAFSRMPLCSRVFLFEPTARAMVDLFEKAVARHARPKHLVTDQGPQFTSAEFEDCVHRHGVRHRLGALGQKGSIALIERFFRTLKEGLSLHSLRPWSRRDFQRRLAIALVHYSYCRPHSALAGQVPAEAYHGIRGHLQAPMPPPRGRRAEPGPEPPVRFAVLDPPNRAFPILVPRAA